MEVWYWGDWGFLGYDTGQLCRWTLMCVTWNYVNCVSNLQYRSFFYLDNNVSENNAASVYRVEGYLKRLGTSVKLHGVIWQSYLWPLLWEPLTPKYSAWTSVKTSRLGSCVSWMLGPFSAKYVAVRYFDLRQRVLTDIYIYIYICCVMRVSPPSPLRRLIIYAVRRVISCTSRSVRLGRDMDEENFLHVHWNILRIRRRQCTIRILNAGVVCLHFFCDWNKTNSLILRFCCTFPTHLGLPYLQVWDSTMFSSYPHSNSTWFHNFKPTCLKIGVGGHSTH
jgi:hypothetical protein